MNSSTRRGFLRSATRAVGAVVATTQMPSLLSQSAGDRPAAGPAGVTVLNPRGRVPVSFIIDDSTCLVNLNKFAVPQFAAAWGPGSTYEKYNWREWPDEIPDSFVRKFGEWCAGHGIKGKYSVVPYPACVGRLDRELPGWTARELEESIKLVRELMAPNWDIHSEMITHTRIIDTKTGHPLPERGLKFMENWEWTTGRSADEIADYIAYALRILKNIGLPCEGITTPGGFGNKALPQLAQATLQAVRDVFGAEVPHYFRHMIDKGDRSVAPRVEYAGGLDGPDPRCVVSIIACTGDWTGGWDNSEPVGADAFITEDLQRGRLVEVVQRGEPACLLAHWTGIFHNGRELGFKIFQEVVRRLHARFDNLIWMKLAELSRYWSAKELTRVERAGDIIRFHAPFACPDFTVKFDARGGLAPRLRAGGTLIELKEAGRASQLASGTWRRDGEGVTACFALPKGVSQIEPGA